MDSMLLPFVKIVCGKTRYADSFVVCCHLRCSSSRNLVKSTSTQTNTYKKTIISSSLKYYDRLIMIDWFENVDIQTNLGLPVCLPVAVRSLQAAVIARSSREIY